jgi:hypothetical protein
MYLLLWGLCWGNLHISSVSQSYCTAMWTVRCKIDEDKVMENFITSFRLVPAATHQHSKGDGCRHVGWKKSCEEQYNSCQIITSQKGKKQSEDDIKKWQQFNSIKYWVSNHLVEAVKDELLSYFCTGNNQQAIQGFKLPLLDNQAIATCFLADHGNIAAMVGRQGLTSYHSKQTGWTR